MGLFSSGDFASIPAFENWDSNVSLAAAVTAATFLVLSTSLFKRPSKDPKIHYISGFSIVHAWRFFTKRFDFLSGNFKKTGKNFFEFYVLQVRVATFWTRTYIVMSTFCRTESWRYVGRSSGRCFIPTRISP